MGRRNVARRGEASVGYMIGGCCLVDGRVLE